MPPQKKLRGGRKRKIKTQEEFEDVNVKETHNGDENKQTRERRNSGQKRKKSVSNLNKSPAKSPKQRVRPLSSTRMEVVENKIEDGEVVSAQFIEGNDFMSMEVQGLHSDFVEEETDYQLGHSVTEDEDSEDEEIEMKSQSDSNNNATVNADKRERKRKQRKVSTATEDSDVPTEKFMEEEDEDINEGEAQLFAKWEKYLQKKREKEELERKNNLQTKFNEKPSNKEKGKNNVMSSSGSETTIYRPAVQKTKVFDKRGSSSSETEIDTSDENIDELIS